MKRKTLVIMTVVFGFTAPLSGIAGETADAFELEPCINGEVSASGMFPTQATEDAYNRARAGQQGSEDRS